MLTVMNTSLKCLFQIEALESSIRDMRMNISNLEQDNKTAVNQIAEQQTEIEHLKSELVDSRSQYKEAAQEVMEVLFQILGRVKRSCLLDDKNTKWL